jgi:hypothetical protein
MRDESEDLRRVGRDEMNLCEFPIASLADRVPEGCKTMVFEDQHGRLTVSGSDAYGLPTAPDSDVIVGLIQLTKLRNDFTNPTVMFSRYELLKLLGWPDQTRYYRRLRESLRRWVGVTLYYDGCWWDNRRKRRVSASFHILDYVVLPDADDPGETSSFAWNKIFFKSCKDGNLKRLDLDTYFSLKSAISKQLYRFLDKRFYVRGDWTFDLPELAHERVGMSRNYTAAKLKEKLRPALKELEGIGFLAPMTPAERYSKTGRGAWNIRVVRQLPATFPRTGSRRSSSGWTGSGRRSRSGSRTSAPTSPRPSARTSRRRPVSGAERSGPRRGRPRERSRDSRSWPGSRKLAHRRNGTGSRHAGRRCLRSGGRRSTPRRWPTPLPPTARRTRRRRRHRSGGCSRPACATPTSDACSACPRRTDPSGRPGRALIAPPRAPGQPGRRIPRPEAPAARPEAERRSRGQPCPPPAGHALPAWPPGPRPGEAPPGTRPRSCGSWVPHRRRASPPAGSCRRR